MAGEYYRVEKVQAVLALDSPRLIDTLRLGGCPTSLLQIVLDQSDLEPESILTVDGHERRVVAMVELQTLQCDYGLSEMPQATVHAALGRELHRLVGAQPNPPQASALAEILERYLGHARVPGRIFATIQAGEHAGEETPEDEVEPPDETLVLFDGYVVAAQSQASAGGRRVLALSMVHFLSDLAASSAVTAQISAASARSFQFHASFSPYIVRTADSVQNRGYLGQTPYAAAQLSIGSGKCMETDFWGYWLPPSGPGEAEQYGIQHFLYAVSRQDLFAWENYRNRALGASACPVGAVPPLNNLAIPALKRIEPFSDVTATNPTAVRASWTNLREVLRTYLAAEDGVTGFGLVPGIDRERLLELALADYFAVGYRYGMPLPFRKSDLGYGPFSPSYGFAADLAKELLQTLGPSSIWDKLVGQYLPRYGMALAPMSTRAVVIPLAPSIRKTWQTIYASDFGQFRTSAELPVEVRGVVLMGRKTSPTGYLAGSRQDDQRARNFEHFLAVYDSCREGQFIFREAPAWLAAAAVLPPALAGANLARPVRPAANSVPSLRHALDAIRELVAKWPQVVAEYSGLGGVGGGALAVVLAARALGVPALIRLGMAYAYAKALYQYERLRNRTCELAGRFRTDIGPGSTVRIEVPADEGVRKAFNEVGREEPEADQFLTGVVQRVSLLISCGPGPATATTSFRLGFVRRQAEVLATSDLSSDGHPVWGSVVPGVPLVDSLWLRGRLGGLAKLN